MSKTSKAFTSDADYGDLIIHGGVTSLDYEPFGGRQPSGPPDQVGIAEVGSDGRADQPMQGIY